MPRRGYIVGVGKTFEFTEKGYAKLFELAEAGHTKKEAAEFFLVSVNWFNGITRDGSQDPEAYERWVDGVHSLRGELRDGQKQLAKVNAQMSIWMGKQHLGQLEQINVEVNQTVHVVGTMPNYKLNSDDWAKQFSPEGAPVPALDKPAVDVEFSEIPTVAEPPASLKPGGKRAPRDP